MILFSNSVLRILDNKWGWIYNKHIVDNIIRQPRKANDFSASQHFSSSYIAAEWNVLFTLLSFFNNQKKNYCTVFLLFSLRVWHKKVLFLPSCLPNPCVYIYIPALAMYKSTGLRYKKKRHWSVSTFVMLAQNVIHAWYFVSWKKYGQHFYLSGHFCLFFRVCVNPFGYVFWVGNVVPVIAQIFSSVPISRAELNSTEINLMLNIDV